MIVALAGCSAQIKQQNLDALHQRASFDFSCPQESLKLTPIGEDGRFGAGTYGVEGCGKRGTYVHTSNNQWMLNTSSGGPEAAQAPAQEGSKQ